MATLQPRILCAILIAIFVFDPSILARQQAASTMKTSIRQRDSFDFDWKFNLGDAAGAEDPALEDSKWRGVQLPHDWSIGLPIDEKAPAWGSGGWFPGGVGWYRKTFDVSREDAGKVFWI